MTHRVLVTSCHPDVDRYVSAVGWDGAQVVDVEVLGTALVVAAIPVAEEVARRRADGIPPVADPWLLRCWGDRDESLISRPSPVRLVGALAIRRQWRTARSAASIFTAFGPRVAAVPADQCGAAALIEAAVTGLGIVVSDGAEISVVASPASPDDRGERTFVHRVVEEAVWDALCRAS